MIHPENIVDAVCSVFHVTREALFSDSRERIISEPRKIAAYLIHSKSFLTYQQIASMFNRKDHTTVLYYIRTVKKNMLTRPWIAQLVADVEQQLQTSPVLEVPVEPVAAPVC